MKPEELKTHIESLYNGNDNYLATGQIQEKSVKTFQESRFPSLKDEAWRHTDISPLYEHTYHKPQDASVTREDIRKFLIPDSVSDVLVFVNGFYKPELSQVATNKNELVITNLQEAKSEYPDYYKQYFEQSGLYQRNIFTAANTAYTSEGAFVLIKKAKMPERLIHLLNISHPGDGNTLVHPRNLIIAEDGSAAKIVESYHTLSEGVAFNNVSTEIFARQDAVIDYHVQQSENDASYQINNMAVEQEKNSRFNYHALSFCGKLIRNQVIVNQNGESCESNLYGLYLANMEKHYDNHVLVNHLNPGGNSKQIYRGILDDASSAVYFGKVYVKRGAQQTYSEQSAKNVLLKDKAQANSKPQLEIYADDVSCAHGSTTGKLDEKALFYLKARGLSHELAQSLLLYAFAKDVVDAINHEAYRNHIDQLLTDTLSRERMNNHCTRLFEEYAEA